jgi:hypothetical protein
MDAKQLNKTGTSFLVDLPNELTAARWYFLSLVALAIPSLPALFERGKESGHTIGSYSLLWLFLLSFAIALLLVELVLMVLLWTRASGGMAQFIHRLYARLVKLGWLNALAILAIWTGFVYLVYWRYQKHFTDFAPQVWLFWLVTGGGALFLAAWKKIPYSLALLATAIFYGAGIKALGYLPEISSYPFSLSWSEASRYYYASLPYSRGLYGFQIPLSSLHPTRYLLQSMAFLAPGAGIAFHRFWQVALWISLSLLTGLALARRFRLASGLTILALSAWAALFVMQGPVYYHLLVCVILVLIGFDRKRFWKTLIFVVLASAWAGISRVNWMPVPAILAAALYLLEKPVCADAALARGPAATWLRYLRAPLAWGIAGGAAALASQAAYVLVSGHENASDFGTSFSSPLLWYRLFPSPTFPLGVIPAILLVSAPLLVLIGNNWRRRPSDWHLLRILGLSGLALILLLGGLVVSAKIGGGSNIHNLDAFLALLLVIGVSIGLGGFASETGGHARVWRPWLLLMALVIVPVIWNLNIKDPFVSHDFTQANKDIDELTTIVQKYASQGEILFITQRQVVMFDQMPGVRMVPDYELMTLMEMAIANNRPYLDRFKQDLQNHRFALIIADRQHTDIMDSEEYSFAEENNAWVENVSQPLLDYYQQVRFFKIQGIQLLVPKK